MNDRLKSFKLVYENCEIVRIPVKYINYVSLIGIKENLVYIEERVVSDKPVERASVSIDTDKLVSKDYELALKDAFLKKYEDPKKYLKELLFDRQDITHLLVNGIEYAVPYDDHATSFEFISDPINYCQKNIQVGSLLDINFSKSNSKEE